MTPRPKKLLNIDANAKTIKGQKRGYMTAILYLAPANLSGYEVCPMRTAGCTNACLNTAGRAGIMKPGETDNAIQRARVAKTKWYFEDRAGFLAKLVKELEAFQRKAHRRGLTPVVRLNGTSDIAWERVPVSTGPWLKHVGMAANIMAMFPDLQFYDYTKVTKRAKAFGRGDMPANYHVTFSLAEDNDAAAYGVLQAGGSVAAVFFKVPETYNNIEVVDGDLSDLRFLDRTAVYVGLKAKGKARKDTSGFVRAA